METRICLPSYDTIVVGLGPSGIAYGMECVARNERTLFLEANHGLGGCWRSSFDMQGLYTEHSPKVMFKYQNNHANELIRRVGAPLNFKDVYSSNLMKQIFKTVWNRISLRDFIKLLALTICYAFNQHDTEITVQGWCERAAVTESFSKVLSVYSILVANTPDKIRMAVLLSTFFTFRMLLSVDQLVSPNEWLERAETALRRVAHYTLRYGATVSRLDANEEGVTHVVTTDGERIAAKRVVLCVPLRNVFRMVESSSEIVHRNWFRNLDSFRYYTEKSSYTGLGFQLHFESSTKYPSEWCWSCMGDWTVIVVDKTHSLREFSKNKSVRTLWSCVVVDLDTVSANLGRSANECENLGDVFREAVRQIESSLGSKLGTYVMTTHNSIARRNSRWEAWESSFSDCFGPLAPTGKISNLHTLGPHNESAIATIDSAVRSVKRFCASNKFKR